MKGPVVLLGPSGAGKSTAGAQVAAALGMAFVDLDHAIGDAATIFKDEGEASFRVREHGALAAALDGSDVVIAAGAGVVDTAPARALLQGRAACVALDVDGATAVQRLRAQSSFPSTRPWLPSDGTALKVWTARDQPRRRHRLALAGATPTVDARAPLEDVVRALGAAIDALKPIRPGACDAMFVDSVALAMESARGLVASGSRALVIAEARVHELHGFSADLLVPGGEPLKSLARIEAMAAALIDQGASRDTLIVAVGGGALLDAVGLTAALLFRGVRWCAVPTTLLAQADAGLGGKTAASLGGRKNLLGAVHAPVRTIVCSAFLSTLSEGELRAGRAEMLKHEMLAADAPADGSARPGHSDVLDDVRRSLAIKSAVVAIDPQERGLRMALNLGHTLAHALEATTSISHGEAVRHGLLRMLELSVGHAGLAPHIADALAQRVRALGPLAAPAVDAAPLERAMAVDKKGGRWVLLRAPGLPVVKRL